MLCWRLKTLLFWQSNRYLEWLTVNVEWRVKYFLFWQRPAWKSRKNSSLQTCSVCAAGWRWGVPAYSPAFEKDHRKTNVLFGMYQLSVVWVMVLGPALASWDWSVKSFKCHNLRLIIKEIFTVQELRGFYKEACFLFPFLQEAEAHL